jgi:hypothetical protein
VFIEPLPSNGRLFRLHYSGFQASCHNTYPTANTENRQVLWGCKMVIHEQKDESTGTTSHCAFILGPLCKKRTEN